MFMMRLKCISQNIIQSNECLAGYLLTYQLMLFGAIRYAVSIAYYISLGEWLDNWSRKQTVLLLPHILHATDRS
jgi:hypothetical protein